MKTTIEGEPVSIVLLNSFGKLTPFGDSNRLRKWMLAQK
jgi:D-alanyl-D-alanine endopeptidase (penicillin-binding protein 7)